MKALVLAWIVLFFNANVLLLGATQGKDVGICLPLSIPILMLYVCELSNNLFLAQQRRNIALLERVLERVNRKLDARGITIKFVHTKKVF